MNYLEEKNDRWLQFAQSYLSMARLGCEEMVNNKYKEDLLETGTLWDSYKITTIFIPTLYNIKHGIEVFIKFLKMSLADKLSNKDFIHNISDLFYILEDEIKRHKIADVIKREYASKPSDTNLNIAVKDIQNLRKFLDDIKELVIKYYHCSLFRDKIGNDFTIEDVENTAFRYPDNEMKINVEYLTVIERISKSEIEEMKNDVDKLMENFNSLGFIFTIYKKHAK